MAPVCLFKDKSLVKKELKKEHTRALSPPWLLWCWCGVGEVVVALAVVICSLKKTLVKKKNIS